MTEISSPYDVTFDFPDMICMRDVASIVAMSHVGTVEAAAPTLAFVYRAIYWPSNCIQASQRDIQLHGGKHFFFFLCSIINFRLVGLGYVLMTVMA